MRSLSLAVVCALASACAEADTPHDRPPTYSIGDSPGGGGDNASGDATAGDPMAGDLMGGDDGYPPVGPCSPNGSGTVVGSVLGHDINPVNTVGTRAVSNIEIIALTAFDATSCEDELDADALFLAPCSLAVGTYVVVEPDAWDCALSPLSAWGLMEEPGGGDIGSATSGTITVTSLTDACVAGSFTLMFGAEAVSGTFDAQRCP